MKKKYVRAKNDRPHRTAKENAVKRPVGRRRKILPPLPAGGAYTKAQLDAMPPRTRLDAIHAMQAEMEYQVRRGELLERAEVEAGNADAAATVHRDLLSTIPDRLARRTGDPAHRLLMKSIMVDCIRAWRQAGLPVPEVN